MSYTPAEAQRALFMAQMNADQFRPDFIPYLRDNLHVYAAFEREALRIAARRTHYSARTIVEVLRHNSALQEHGSEWKLSDWWTPHLARLFALMNPQHAGLFEFRESKAAKRGRAFA
jgi:hypothetical protein